MWCHCFDTNEMSALCLLHIHFEKPLISVYVHPVHLGKFPFKESDLCWWSKCPHFLLFSSSRLLVFLQSVKRRWSLSTWTLLTHEDFVILLFFQSPLFYFYLLLYFLSQYTFSYLIFKFKILDHWTGIFGPQIKFRWLLGFCKCALLEHAMFIRLCNVHEQFCATKAKCTIVT